MQANGKLSLSNCRQAFGVNRNLARCSMQLKHCEQAEEKKSMKSKSKNSHKRINFDSNQKAYDPKNEAKEKLAKTEECKSNMNRKMHSMEYIIANRQNNYVLPDLGNSSKKEVSSTNSYGSEITITLISNLQTPINSNISTNLSLYSTMTEKAYVDLSESYDRNNSFEISEKERANKKFAY